MSRPRKRTNLLIHSSQVAGYGWTALQRAGSSKAALELTRYAKLKLRFRNCKLDALNIYLDDVQQEVYCDVR